ncbi:MAG: hypothetical protein K8S23_14235 [Candidatus Cloacimonetes bacterium]|nr:hypothetical protein [Candidatus Cloacimonadota bacterium]
MTDSAWNQKRGALSDKSARIEFGLTQEEIYEGMQSGKLQYKLNYIHGNPYYRLLRNEVESFVIEKFGEDYIKNRKLENELSEINKEIRKLKRQLKSLEKERVKLIEEIGK